MAENTPLHGYHIVFIYLSLDGHLVFSHFLAIVNSAAASSVGKESACNAGDPFQSLGQEDPPGSGKEMAAPSSILAWRIPWTEEPGRLQSVGS